MLLSNTYDPDVRVQREAEALVEAGYRVSIICWDRQSGLAPKETVSGIDVIRVQDVKSSHGLGWKQLMYLPRFWRKAWLSGRRLGPDFVHCHDLDTLYAGRRLKKLTGAALIFDAHEYYPASMSLYLPGLLVRLLDWWEGRLIRKADAVITASTVLRDEYLARGISPVEVLGNYPDPKRFPRLPAAKTRDARRSLGVNDEALLVGYIGGFSRNRMILPFIEAAALCPDVHFAVWGDGDQREAVEAAAESHPNVRCYGWADPEELPLYFQASDVIYYGLRLDYPGAQYNAPNTLTQAMITARPVIATNVGDLGRMVETTGCGVLIEEATPQAIAAAIGELRTTEQRRVLGERGYEAALQRYNADVVKKRLVELYDALVS